MDRFSVSIKGVLEVNGKYLLRKNERQEYELLGGRLDKSDKTAEARVFTEFIEESGITVDVCEQREPWLYEIGTKNIIVVPYVCKAISIPEVLFDEDGGTLHWLTEAEALGAYMPQGYKDSITNSIPHKAYSIPAKFFFKIIPNYVERDYFVDICVKDHGNIILHVPLEHFYSPRDFAYWKLGERYKDAILASEPVEIDRKRDTIVLNYSIKKA